MNQFEFIRNYRSLANERLDDIELLMMYKELQTQTIGTRLRARFEANRPDRLDQVLAIDSVAHELHKESRNEVEPVMADIFPDADITFLKKALDKLAGLESDEASPLADVRKFTRGYFTNLLSEDDSIMLLEKQVGKTSGDDIGDVLAEYERHYVAGIASPGEILTLHRADPANEMYRQAVKDGKFDEEENEPVIVGGPASVELIDRQGHLITTAALTKAFVNHMKNVRTRNIMIMHSDVQVGWPLPAYINKGGEVFKSGVDEKGLWLISELRNDTKIAKKTAEEVKKGVLKSYSIAGTAGNIEYVEKGGKSFMQVNDLELAETTICETGVNQGAFFNMLKSIDTARADLSLLLNSFDDSVLLTGYGVVVEKATGTVVIVSDTKSMITDQLQLQLEEMLPLGTLIAVKSVSKLEEFIPIYKTSITGLWKTEVETETELKSESSGSLKLEKDEVNYVAVALTGNSCAYCHNFNKDGTCDKVQGAISSGGYCEQYDGKEDRAVENPFIETEIGTVTHKKNGIRKTSSGRPRRPNLVASSRNPNFPKRWVLPATRSAQEAKMSGPEELKKWVENIQKASAMPQVPQPGGQNQRSAMPKIPKPGGGGPANKDLVPLSGDPQHPVRWVLPKDAPQSPKQTPINQNPPAGRQAAQEKANVVRQQGLAGGGTQAPSQHERWANGGQAYDDGRETDFAELGDQGSTGDFEGQGFRNPDPDLLQERRNTIRGQAQTSRLDSDQSLGGAGSLSREFRPEAGSMLAESYAESDLTADNSDITEDEYNRAQSAIFALLHEIENDANDPGDYDAQANWLESGQEELMRRASRYMEARGIRPDSEAYWVVDAFMPDVSDIIYNNLTRMSDQEMRDEGSIRRGEYARDEDWARSDGGTMSRVENLRAWLVKSESSDADYDYERNSDYENDKGTAVQKLELWKYANEPAVGSYDKREKAKRVFLDEEGFPKDEETKSDNDYDKVDKKPWSVNQSGNEAN